MIIIMQPLERHRCIEFGLRSGLHQCIHCNYQYQSIHELIAHQRQSQHFVGHYVLKQSTSRSLRLAARVMDPQEEERTDQQCGSYNLSLEIDYNATDDEVDSTRDSCDKSTEHLGVPTALNMCLHIIFLH